MFIYIKKFSARSHASFSLSDDKYAYIFGLFANFSPKSSPTYYQAYFRNASMLASVMGCPKHSIRIARCLSEIFRPQRWLTRSWMSCVFMMLPSFIFFFVLSGRCSRVFLRFVRGSLAPRCLFFFLLFPGIGCRFSVHFPGILCRFYPSFSSSAASFGA